MEPFPLIGSNATVVMVVNGTPITINVNGTDAPITAGNFVDLVERGVYDGVSFHRIVREPEPFVVQGGDPQSKDPNVPQNQLGTGGFIDPATNQPRNIPLEIKPQGFAAPVYGETFQDAGIALAPELPHRRGAVAMARSLSPNSASSQFYFALDDLPQLDGSYAVFGYITSGLEAIDTIERGDRIAAAEVTDGALSTRTSGIIGNLNALNDFLNFINYSTLPLGFTDFSPGDDAIALTPEMTQQTPSGVRAFSGNDRITGSPANDIANGNQGNDTLSGEAGLDFLRGGRDNDVIFGGSDGDILNGNRGNDNLDGGDGDDFVRGGQENDTLTGGNGNDYLVGDFGFDSLTGNAGADTFLLRVDTAVGQGLNGDRIVDLTVAQGDRIGIVGAVNLPDLQFNPSGNDTLIQLPNGNTLGIVQNMDSLTVQNAVFIAPNADLAMAIG